MLCINDLTIRGLLVRAAEPGAVAVNDLTRTSKLDIDIFSMALVKMKLALPDGSDGTEEFTASYPLPPIHCLLFTASYSLPPIHCLLFNASYSMPPIQCLLFNAYSMPPI